MSDWQPIETAPRDGTKILLLSVDREHIVGWWDARRINFYKSQKGWASYDPAKALGAWVSHLLDEVGDNRLYCGRAPKHWQPLPPPPAGE